MTRKAPPGTHCSVAFVTRQALASVQQLPILLRSSARNTFFQSLVLFPHTFSVLAMPVPKKHVPPEAGCWCFFTTISFKPSFKPDTFILRHHPLVSREQGHLKLAGRASRKEGMLLGHLALSNGLACTIFSIPMIPSPNHGQDLVHGFPHLLCHVHTIWRCWRCAGNQTCQDHSFSLC